MRRLPPRLTRASSRLFRAAAATAAVLVVAVPATAAYATDPTTPPATGGASGAPAANNVGPATPGEALCTLQSTTLTQVSGMIVTAAGIQVVEARDTNAVILFAIDQASCKPTSKTYSGAANPLDPQDLQVGADGTIWVGDLGDPDDNRQSVAFHRIAPGTTAAVTSRVTYPTDIKNPSAKAFLIDKDDLPVVFTIVDGTPGATLYKPTKALVPNTQTGLPPLGKVGQFTPVAADSSAAGAGVVVTGAAKSPDGKKIVLRTGAYAYEYDIPDGDIVKAVTTGTPRVTQLPGEADGEAIAYNSDGTKFLTLSAKPTGATDSPKLLSFTPFIPPVVTQDDSAPTQPAGDAGGSFFKDLTLSQLTRIVAAVGVVGLVLAIAGIVGIRRARRRRREEEEEYDDEYYDDRPRRGGRGGGRAAARGHEEPAYEDQYGGGGYADAGYGQAQNGYAQPGYDQYGGQQYGGGYDQYGQPQYGAEQYGAQPGYDQYGQPQQYGGQQYGSGYGYEEEFDPMHDPRRR